jgi:hypothetical protein
MTMLFNVPSGRRIRGPDGFKQLNLFFSENFLGSKHTLLHERYRVEKGENEMRALNEPTAEPIQHHKLVHGRMKGSFMPMYQTILSIIQGVALADLASLVVAMYPQFTVVHWLMVLTTFFLLIVVYTAYSIQSAVWDWIPDIRDASLPFIFGALELFVIHTIELSMCLWFLGLAGISVLGAVGTVHLVWRAHEESENEELLELLWPHHRLFMLNYIGGAGLALCLPTYAT